MHLWSQLWLAAQLAATTSDADASTELELGAAHGASTIQWIHAAHRLHFGFGLELEKLSEALVVELVAAWEGSDIVSHNKIIAANGASIIERL